MKRRDKNPFFHRISGRKALDKPGEVCYNTIVA